MSRHNALTAAWRGSRLIIFSRVVRGRLVGERYDAEHECNDERNAENRYGSHGHVLRMKSPPHL
jgi:hypothetical protein